MFICPESCDLRGTEACMLPKPGERIVAQLKLASSFVVNNFAYMSAASAGLPYSPERRDSELMKPAEDRADSIFLAAEVCAHLHQLATNPGAEG